MRLVLIIFSVIYIKRMLSKAKDITMGLTNEARLIMKLKHHFCPLYKEEDLKKTEDKYAKWDWEGTTNGTHFEMKSRRNTKKYYPTTLLPVHKVVETDKPQVFIFHFSDKTCYIQYEPYLFSKFPQRMGQTFRDGKLDPPQLQYEIPVVLLIDLEDVPL